MTGSSLVTKTIAVTKGFWTGRRTYALSGVTWHHTAGKLSLQQIINVLQASSLATHYGVDSSGAIGQYVSEDNAAFTTGNTVGNCTTISLEISNTVSAEPWTVSDAAIEAAIALTVDIFKRYGWTKAVRGQNFFVHQDWVATVCPGTYIMAHIDAIIAEINKRLNGYLAPVSFTNVNYTLSVPGNRCEYFAEASVENPLGYLPQGEYEIVSISQWLENAAENTPGYWVLIWYIDRNYFVIVPDGTDCCAILYESCGTKPGETPDSGQAHEDGEENPAKPAPPDTEQPDTESSGETQSAAEESVQGGCMVALVQWIIKRFRGGN